MPTPHLGSPPPSSKRRGAQREGRKGCHGTPGKVRDSESVSTPQGLQGCPAAAMFCVVGCASETTLFLAGSPLPFLQLGVLWVSWGPCAGGLLQRQLSPEAPLCSRQGRASSSVPVPRTEARTPGCGRRAGPGAWRAWAAAPPPPPDFVHFVRAITGQSSCFSFEKRYVEMIEDQTLKPVTFLISVHLVSQHELGRSFLLRHIHVSSQRVVLRKGSCNSLLLQLRRFSPTLTFSQRPKNVYLH